MKTANTISLNRIMYPDNPVTDFIHFAADSGFRAIELRNDLSDSRILGAESALEVAAVLKERGVSVLTINALQRFNDPELFPEKKKELKSLIKEAAAVHCPMIILCPVCDPSDARPPGIQARDLIAALDEYSLLFRDSGMVGLIEPLGFPISSVRYKRQAADAIAGCGSPGLYNIVHDTFHHYLSGETEIFPELTGLLHISGVLPGKSKESITDDDRVFIDDRDIMDNRGQIAGLLEAGCQAPISFEPFSSEVQKYSEEELRRGIAGSLAYVL